MKRAAFLLSLVTLSATVSVDAKGITRRLVISAPHLSEALELTEPAGALASVWGGEFLGARATVEPDPSWPRFAVAFYVQPPRRQEVKLAYTVTYVRDPNGGGFVYLPGIGEEGYRLNASAILRRSQDGRWHHAGAAWSQALNTRLP